MHKTVCNFANLVGNQLIFKNLTNKIIENDPTHTLATKIRIVYANSVFKDLI